MAEKTLQIHAEVRAHSMAANAKYKVDPSEHHCKKEFKKGDLVMAHLGQSRFPSIRAKLHNRKYGAF